MVHVLYDPRIYDKILAQVDKGDNWQQNRNGVGKHPDGGITSKLVKVISN